MRPLGRAHLDSHGIEIVQKAQAAIRDVLSLWQRSRVTAIVNEFSCCCRMFVALGNVKPLVEMATDELFHRELGRYMDEISNYLERGGHVSDDISRRKHRFWALQTGLIFAHFKQGDKADIRDKLDLMDALVRQ